MPLSQPKRLATTANGQSRTPARAPATAPKESSTHSATEQLGPIGSQAEGAVGMLVHSTLAFNMAGTPLGLLDVQCWVRDPEEFGKKPRRALGALILLTPAATRERAAGDESGGTG